jgi:ferredoxin-NADP reductase
MTSLYLVLWIALAIVLQLGIYLGIGFWRHWMDYQRLRHRAADLGLPELPETSPAHEASAARPASTAPAWSGLRTFRIERKVIEDGAQSISSFYLAPEDGQALPSFFPGQFLTFRLDIPGPNGVSEQVVRCYSLSEAPRSDYYRVSIKRVPAPAGTDILPGRASNYFHDQLDVGSLLQVRAPGGHFHIERDDTPVVLIAGGIGITPMLSMLNWCLAEQPGREVWLFYGVRNSREMVMKSLLETLAAKHAHFHLRVCFSNPLPDDIAVRDYQHRARVDIRVLRLQLPLKAYHFYLCGPTALMESLVPALDEWGVPEARIHFEAFGPSSIQRKAAALSAPKNEGAVTDIVVNFARSGKQVAWQPGAGSLLEFAEASGIAVNSGCRAGSCGSCQTTIQSGEVTYHQSPDYDPEPGSCLLCVCAPKTSVTLEA